MRAHLLGTLVALATWQLVIGQENLLRNPSFENEVVDADWKGAGFLMERVTDDVYEGTYAIKCSQRDRGREGPIQIALNVTQGKTYQFEGHFKLLNGLQGKLWQTFKIVLQYTIPGVPNLKTNNIALSGFGTPQRGWFKVEGSMAAPSVEFTEARLALRGPDPEVAFLADDLKLYEIPEDSSWRAQSYQNIEDHRKGNINVMVILPSNLGNDKAEIIVTHKKHQFAFGSLVYDYLILEEPMSEYFKLFKYLFNWATVQSYKWKFDASNDPKNNPDFTRAFSTSDRLNSEGIKVRAHSIFWDKESNSPQYVIDLPDSELNAELHKRVQFMMEEGVNRVAQWDVQNEHVRNHYYEERLHMTNITKELYQHARAVDPTVPLYFNDYDAAGAGTITQDLYDVAMEYLSQGVPLDGLGLQSHIKEFTKPSPSAIWQRLDKLQQTGLDLMITEFDFEWSDVIERADGFEDAVRAYFGHPGLSGLVLWGFWNNYMNTPNEELVRGNDMEIVEPGQRWACLLKKEWTTRVTRDLQVTNNFDMRGFKGEYEVVIERNGVPVQRDTFVLGDQDAWVPVFMTSDTTEITLPEPEHDYVPECISHRAQRSLGKSNHLGFEPDLTCTTRGGQGWSGTNEDDFLTVTCNSDEVMTSCFSVHEIKKYTRKGEMIIKEAGIYACKAVNGINSNGGVKPFARCCKVEGLSCEYMSAGPSFPFDGAKAEAVCNAEENRIPVGCSSFSQYPESDGSYPNLTSSSCLAQSGTPVLLDPKLRSGSEVWAACCSAPGLECVVKYSGETPPIKGKHRMVACDPGWALTGCNVFAEQSNAGGAKIIWKNGEDNCRAFMGASLGGSDARGAKAVATCCRVIN